MAQPNVEAAWRAEFKRIHATEAFHSGNVFPDDPKPTFRWSGDEAEARRLQEEHTHHYLRWDFLRHCRRYDRWPYRRRPIVSGLKPQVTPPPEKCYRLAEEPMQRPILLVSISVASSASAFELLSRFVNDRPRTTKPSADRGAYEEQGNSHEPERDDEHVYAHLPSPLLDLEECAGGKDATPRSASNPPA